MSGELGPPPPVGDQRVVAAAALDDGQRVRRRAGDVEGVVALAEQQVHDLDLVVRDALLERRRAEVQILVAETEPDEMAERRRVDRRLVDAVERGRLGRVDRAQDAVGRREHGAVVVDVERVRGLRLVDADREHGQRRVDLRREADALLEAAILDLAAVDEQRAEHLVERVRLQGEGLHLGVAGAGDVARVRGDDDDWWRNQLDGVNVTYGWPSADRCRTERRTPADVIVLPSVRIST